MGSKLWGGRFQTEQNVTLENLNNSIETDKIMWEEDIQASIAYSKTIFAAGLIDNEERISIENGLKTISDEWRKETFQIKSSDEDIHSANERRLKELIGQTGGKLHTGRSRNDQVATDFRLWVMKSTEGMKLLLKSFILTLVNRADTETEIIMPGYTHLQRAQAIRWSHWLLSHAWSFKKDLSRLDDVYQTADECPLGSGALAGNPFNVDRNLLAKELSFSKISDNSLLAVADRDFVALYLFWTSMTSIHLSKLAEDLILFSSSEFGFVKLSDAFATGSSLMPQKKNPDGLELIRGKTARIIGNLTAFLCTLKSLPSTYNKDLQEDKEILFSSLATIRKLVEVANGTVATLKVNATTCRNALTDDMLATDLAYYLVRKGIPFRDAHEKTGEVVKKAEELKCSLSQVPLEELTKICDSFSEDSRSVWSFQSSLEQYQAYGGTGSTSVTQQIKNLRQFLNEN